VNRNELTEEVRHLIHSSVPTVDALELLVLLVRRPGRTWTLPQLIEALRPTVLPEPVLREYLAGFKTQGFLVEAAGGAFEFHPPPGPRAGALAALLTAYDERPVTLIRTIYAIADSKTIQAFADAFKLKKDD
jgi:hypothetical protein